MLIDQLLTSQQKRKQLQRDLDEQIAQKHMLKSNAFQVERQNDLYNLDVCKSTYLAEERAIQAKQLKEK